MKKPYIIKRATAILLVSQMMATFFGAAWSLDSKVCSWWGECWLAGNLILLAVAAIIGMGIGIVWLVTWLWTCND